MSATSRKQAAKREARGLVVDLIYWEMNAADGERMAEACEQHGAALINECLHELIEEQRRLGANP